MDETVAALALRVTPGLGPVTARRLLDAFGSARSVLEAPARSLAAAAGRPVEIPDRATAQAERLVAACRRHGIRAVPITAEAYPAALRAIYDPPTVLFAVGSLPRRALLPVHEVRALAVVGTRAASSRARGYAERIGAEAAAAGVVVVSGLAIGADAAAHEGALSAFGEPRAAPTVAVLAGGLDEVRPAANAGLASRIVEGGGALLSEDPPGSPLDKGRFVARNRIVSGLARGVVVVEAGARSGALHTADFALDQGRAVFVVPDHPSARHAAGGLALLAQGATPVIDPRDVLREFGWAVPDAPVATPTELRPILAALAELGPAPPDRLGMEARQAFASLADLELRGWARRDDQGRYALTLDGRRAAGASQGGARRVPGTPGRRS